VAVVTTKSAGVTSADASPQDLVSPKIIGGRLRETIGKVAIALGDSPNSVLHTVRLPSRARISQILLLSDGNATEATADVGVYRTAANGGAAVDIDHFASAVILDGAVVTGTDITHEADPADAGAGFGKADVAKPLWESLGFSADPQAFLDICFTLQTGATGAGVVGLKVRWTED
jgi:hypothetical protein